MLTDRVAVVTGASSGIGAGLAVMLADEGARVVLAARRGDELERVAAGIRRAGWPLNACAAASWASSGCDTGWAAAIITNAPTTGSRATRSRTGDRGGVDADRALGLVASGSRPAGAAKCLSLTVRSRVLADAARVPLQRRSGDRDRGLRLPRQAVTLDVHSSRPT